MAQLEISTIVRESLSLLESNMVASILFSRDEQLEYRAGLAKDDTIQIRRPTAATITNYNGTSVTPTEIEETKVNLKLERHFDANIKVTSRDMTLGIVDFSSQVLAPYMLAMAEEIDKYAVSKFRQFPYTAPSGVPAAGPTSIGDVAKIRKVLNDNRVPMAGRVGVVDTDFETDLLSIDSFVEADKIGDEGTTIREASLGRVMGLNWFMDQNVDSTEHTAGTLTSLVVNGARNKGSSTIMFDGASSTDGTLVEGDILTIAGYPENLVVAADVTASGSAGVITITEELRFDLADNAAVTVYAGGSSYFSRGAVFNSNAIALAAVPLALPSGAGAADQIQDRGFGIRAVYDYDRDLKSDILSLDILVGAKVIDGRMGAQLITSD